MNRHSTTFCTLGILLLLLGFPPGVHAAEPMDLGRALYRGQIPWQRGTSATEAGLPLEFSACARCHGPLGEGGAEGGQPVPALDDERLWRHDGQQPAYESDKAVLSAIEQGVGRGGRSLSPIMPRFRLQPAERRALLTYLHRVGTMSDQPAGVERNRIRIGVPIPTKRTDAAASAIQKGLTDTVNAANAAGGVHGRTVELLFAPQIELEKLMAQKRIFALAGGWLGPNFRPELLARLESGQSRHGLAHIASLIPADVPATLEGGWTAPLLPSLRELYSELLAAEHRACPGPGQTVILGDLESWKRTGLPLPESKADSKLSRFALAGINTKPTQDKAWIDDAPGGHACFGFLPLWQGVPPPLPANWRVFFASPLPPGLLADGAMINRSPWETLGHIAGITLVEALAEAGPKLHERSLLEALPRLNGRTLEPGLTLSFTASRMHGFVPTVAPIRPPPLGQPDSDSLTAVHSSLGD